jgi:peroxiredoxin
VGVLAQSREAVKRYIEDTGLAFDVLIDDSRDTLRAYGVWHRVGLDGWNISRPAVFLIDADRKIRASWIGEHQQEYPSAAEILRASSQ